MTDGALSFLQSGGEEGAWTPTYPTVREQQRELRDELRSGLPDRASILLWQHAVSAVSVGQISDEWYPSILTNRWEAAALIGDADMREDITDHPPSKEQAWSVRQDIIEYDLLPAFREALAKLRQHALEESDDDITDPDRQRFIALRPRLHQLAIAQHNSLRQALGVGEHTAPQTRETVADWLETVLFATAGYTEDGFEAAVMAPFGEWRPALANGGAYLEILLAQDVLPAMNQALRNAADRSSERISTAPRREEGGIPHG